MPKDRGKKNPSKNVGNLRGKVTQPLTETDIKKPEDQTPVALAPRVYERVENKGVVRLQKATTFHSRLLARDNDGRLEQELEQVQEVERGDAELRAKKQQDHRCTRAVTAAAETLQLQS